MILECCYIDPESHNACQKQAKFGLSNGCPYEDCYACEEHLAELMTEDDVVSEL